MAAAWLLGWIKGSDHNTFQDREAVVSVCVNSLQAPLDEADLSSDSPTDAQIALISSARTALAASEPLCKKAADLPGHGGENIRKRLQSIVASSGALIDCVVDGLFFESFDCEDEARSYADRYEDLRSALADRSDLWDLLSEGASDR